MRSGPALPTRSPDGEGAKEVDAFTIPYGAGGGCIGPNKIKARPVLSIKWRERDDRFGSWLCENHSSGRRRARLILAARHPRMKESPRPQSRFSCCALAAASRVFTQPGSNSAIPPVGV